MIHKKKENKGDGRSAGKMIAAAAVMLAAGICVVLICMKVSGGKAVAYDAVKESDIPHGIAADIIPEYKSLERALACVDDDEVYVIVTRGEKPTSGYKVSVRKLILEKDADGTTLAVYASFSDPGKKTSVSQIITYPVQVVKTDLKKLPDSIELRIQYD